MNNTDTKYLSEAQYIQPKMPMRMKAELPDMLSDMINGSHDSHRIRMINELIDILENAEDELIF